MAGTTPQQFDQVGAIALDDLAALPELVGAKSEKEKKIVTDTIAAVKDIVSRHGRVIGYKNFMGVWSGYQPKAIAAQRAAEVTVTNAALAAGYEHGDNPKSVLA